MVITNRAGRDRGEGMSEKRIGVAVSGANTTAVLDGIKRAEELGIHAAWLTTGGARLDSITALAAAADRTRDIMFGTSIVPTYPRHPLVMVQQAQVVAQLAPGRFRLGVGPSHRPSMEAMGMDFRSPLGHLREYLQILKALLQTGQVDMDGKYYKAHETIPEIIDIPVMASALQPKSFEVCGEESDGAISWVCPGEYLREVALPAMKVGAERAGRPVPPLIAHAPVCVHDNPAEVRDAVRQRVTNPRMPFYQRMFAAAGYSEASIGTWSDAMVDATALFGNEEDVEEKIEGLFAIGATEVLASPVPAGPDEAASLERTLQLLGKVSKSMGS